MSATTNTFTKNGRQLAIASAILGIAMLIGTGIYTIRQSNPNHESIISVPEKAEITSVSALGRIEPQGEVINVAASPSMSGAKVKTLLVEEGSQVKKGDVIAITTDYYSQQAELNRAEKEVKVAEANLAIIKAGAKEGEINAQKAIIERLNAQLQGQKTMDQAKIARLQAQLTTERQEKQATIGRIQAELNNVRSDLQRYQKLADEGAISESELAQRQLAVATANESVAEAQASYQKTVTTLEEEIIEAKAQKEQNNNTLVKQIIEAEARLDEIAEVRSVDVAQAQAELEKAIAMLKQAQIDLDLTQIKAPIEGEILDIKAYPGENIDNVDGVVEIGNTQQMLVVAEVYESDISKVKLGQVVKIRSENNSFQEAIEGKVIEISSKIGKKDVLETDPAASVDARVVEVKIAINPQDNNTVKNLIYSQVIVNILL